MTRWLAALALLAPLQGLADDGADRDIHYRTVVLRFDAPWPKDSEHAPGERRQVAWSYPVFADRDSATRKLNGWLRLQSIAQLAPDTAVARDAPRLTDRQVVARAAHDPAFIGSGVQAAWVDVQMAAGPLRSFTFTSTEPGADGVHNDSQNTSMLYDMRDGQSPAIGALFADDADPALDALFQAALRQDAGVECREERHFAWDVAELVAPDTLVEFFGFKAYEDPRCLEVQITGPEVTRLLKTPADLAPVHRLVKDRR